ncbi:hypothetical protein QUB70_31010 [Microcoleus sp. A003_D6]
MPVPQENLSLVERAPEPVFENGAKFEFLRPIRGWAAWMPRRNLVSTPVRKSSFCL